jgi:thioredoxin 1
MNIEVLKFSASWCGPCRVLAQTLKDVVGIKNIDVNENIELSAQYGVRNIPLIVFLRDGKELGRVSGAITKEKYEELINEYTLNQ